jgi:hypothetical protein
LGVCLENLQVADLAGAKRVVADGDSTTVIGGCGSKATIQARAAEIRRLIEARVSSPP